MRKILLTKSTVLSVGFFVGLLAFGFFFLGEVGAQTDTARRDELQRQLDALEREATEIDANITATQQEANTLQNQITIYNSEIRRRELEIRRLTLAIRQAEIDIEIKEEDIEETSGRISKNRGLLADNIRQLHDLDQESMVVVLAKNDTLNDFFTSFDNVRSLQMHVGELVGSLRETKQELEQEKLELSDFKEQQGSLRSLSEIEKRAVNDKKNEKDEILRLTKGKEAVYQQILAEKKRDIAALRTQLFYLERTGISAEDALRFAELASERTGIRPAFLLAILEVETGRQFEGGVISAGTNLGTGNWKADMYDCYVGLGRRTTAENQKAAFFKITSALGFNPDEMPVSRMPSYGCGGAMGPAQFIPTTWVLFEDRVASLTGHRPPNPWSVEDAFTASSIFLADSGARSQIKDGEIAAARTYISGRPNCPASGVARVACISYANRVYSLSLEIDKVI